MLILFYLKVCVQSLATSSASLQLVRSFALIACPLVALSKFQVANVKEKTHTHTHTQTHQWLYNMHFNSSEIGSNNKLAASKQQKFVKPLCHMLPILPYISVANYTCFA